MTEKTINRSFRATQALIDRLHHRAQLESVALGLDVSISDIIRRGIEWALAQPLHGLPSRRQCNVVEAIGGSGRCLECKHEFSPTADRSTWSCPRDGGAAL